MNKNIHIKKSLSLIIFLFLFVFSGCESLNTIAGMTQSDKDKQNVEKIKRQFANACINFVYAKAFALESIGKKTEAEQTKANIKNLTQNMSIEGISVIMDNCELLTSSFEKDHMFQTEEEKKAFLASFAYFSEATLEETLLVDGVVRLTDAYYTAISTLPQYQKASYMLVYSPVISTLTPRVAEDLQLALTMLDDYRVIAFANGFTEEDLQNAIIELKNELGNCVEVK